MSNDSDQLIPKYLSGTATAEESQQVKDWIAQSAENKKLYEDYKKIWATNDIGVFPEFDSAEELKRLNAALDKGTTKTKLFTTTPLPFVFKVAASLSLFLVSAFLFYLIVLKTGTVVRESGNTKIHFALPDGSVIWLNEKSKLTYNEDFKSRRHLELNGEGFFEVIKNPDKPFIIKANNSAIRVLGTSFNVRAYKGEKQEEVYVVTGKVSMSNTQGDNQTIILKPGERGILNKNNVLLSDKTEDLNVTAWKTKQLIFRKATLYKVAETLEKYFRISITIKNPKLQKCRFTSSFQDPTLEEVIEAISIALNINIIHQSKDYVFDGEGC